MATKIIFSCTQTEKVENILDFGIQDHERVWLQRKLGHSERISPMHSVNKFHFDPISPRSPIKTNPFPPAKNLLSGPEIDFRFEEFFLLLQFGCCNGSSDWEVQGTSIGK